MGRGKEKGKQGNIKTGGSAGQNRKQSEDFLDKNILKKEVQVTDSGLQFIVIQDTQGQKPSADNTVVVNHRIQLLNGTFLADTYKGIPEKFPMKEGVKGYQEGLEMMSVGAKYKFFIPPELAWGKKGVGKRIGPYATLIIDVRLEEII